MTTDGQLIALPNAAGSLERLLSLRASLHDEREKAPTPAVARALEMADYYVFLALGYVGYVQELFPEES